MIAIALGAFAGILYKLGVPLVLDKHTAPLAIAVAGLFIFFYRVLWCLGNGDSQDCVGHSCVWWIWMVGSQTEPAISAPVRGVSELRRGRTRIAVGAGG